MIKNKLENIKKLLNGEIHKSKSKIKKELGKLIIHIVNKYKEEHKKYPLLINDIKNIKDPVNDVLNPFYKEFKEDIEFILSEIFAEDIETTIESFLKKEKRYPSKMSEFDILINDTFSQLGINDKTIKILLRDYIISKINKVSKTNKMRNLFKEAYIKNKDLFIKFIYMNLDNDKKYKEFEEIGGEIKKIMENVEDEGLRHMEGGLHGDKSASVSDKYRSFIKTIFPLYMNIGVKTKKLSKEEMAEYIKKMSNK